MSLTLVELKQRLSAKNPDDLLELLRLDSETIVELATDLIEERFEELSEEVDDVAEFSPEW